MTCIQNSLIVERTEYKLASRLLRSCWLWNTSKTRKQNTFSSTRSGFNLLIKAAHNVSIFRLNMLFPQKHPKSKQTHINTQLPQKANTTLSLKHPTQTFSSAQDSKASLSLEAAKNKLEKHLSLKMSFGGERDDIPFWNRTRFLHSCFTIMLWKKTPSISKLFQLIRTAELYKEAVMLHDWHILLHGLWPWSKTLSLTPSPVTQRPKRRVIRWNCRSYSPASQWKRTKPIDCYAWQTLQCSCGKGRSILPSWPLDRVRSSFTTSSLRTVYIS